MFRNSVIGRSVRILSSSDRKKIVAVIAIQISFGLLDLAGIALVGILGALAITGAQSKEPGNRVSQVLQFLQLDESSLQSQATIIGLMAVTLLVTKTVLSVIFVRKTVFFLARRSASISANLISKVLAQPLMKVQSRSMQQTLYTVTSGVEAIAMGVLNTTVLLISDISLLVILGIGLFVVDPAMALSTLFVFGGIAYLLYRLMQFRAIRLGEEQRLLSIESSERILEVLNSYREIVIRNRRNFYSRELSNIRYRLADVTAERTFMPNISKYVIEITVVLGALAIAGIQFAINDAARAVAVLSVFMAASTRISPAVLRLQQGAIFIKSSIGSAGPTLDLIEELDTIVADGTKIDELDFAHDGFTGEIKLANVSLTYPTKNKPAVKNISLQIQQGQAVAFVGPSGAGKTTLIDLILGVLTPDSGVVQIQGNPPLTSIRHWPGAIGYVPQDVMISNGTIRQNVGLGYSISDMPEESIWRALEVAQLADFVRGLPEGLDTPVGDRGTRLSGGQRQRLGIARAMFTKPKLLVLDEATSALDGSTEASISDAVHNLKGGVTIVIIAHRLSTVKESDVIHYLTDGDLVMSGSFEELRQNVPEFERQVKLMGLESS